MKTTSVGLLTLVTLFSSSGLAPGSEHPRILSECLAQQPELSPWLDVNPYYLRADFDGDGGQDHAVLVTQRATSDVGILVCLRSGSAEILGLSNPIGAGGWRDLDFIDLWMVYEKQPVLRGADEGPPPTLEGDALLLVKLESASGLLYRNAKGWHWYQQGD